MAILRYSCPSELVRVQGTIVGEGAPTGNGKIGVWKVLLYSQ